MPTVAKRKTKKTTVAVKLTLFILAAILGNFRFNFGILIVFIRKFLSLEKIGLILPIKLVLDCWGIDEETIDCFGTGFGPGFSTDSCS